MRLAIRVSIALIVVVGAACGSTDPESTDDTHTLGASTSGGASDGASDGDARWPERPSGEARFHVILHPIDIRAENVEPDAVDGMDQFFIDHVHREAPEVFIAPPGSPVPDGLLGYVLEPAVDVVDDQPDRCHVEVQLILMTHEDDLRADISTSAAAVEGEGHHRQRHAVQAAFGAGLTKLREALEAAALRDDV